MAGNRDKWLRVLRSRRPEPPSASDIPPLLDDPDPLVRVCAAALLWDPAAEPERVRAATDAAVRSGDRDAVVYGCHLLQEAGPAAGDIVPLVWGYLRHPDGGVRANAAYALFKCCRDKAVLAEAAAQLTDDTGDTLHDATIRYAAHKLRQAAGGETENG